MMTAPNKCSTAAKRHAESGIACATSWQIAASFTLDQTVPHDQPGQVSLRSTYARHADILREQIDGATGDRMNTRARPAAERRCRVAHPA